MNYNSSQIQKKFYIYFEKGASPSTNELKDIFETQSFGNVAHDNTSVIPEEL